MRDGHRALFIIPLIILIILVIVFRVELLVTGLKLAGFAHKSYRAERYVADYYRNNAMLSQELANTMYMDVLDGLQKRIKTETGDQKAKDAAALGLMYECGKGVPMNLKTAQQWYQVAVDSNTNKENTIYQAELERVNGGMKTPAPAKGAAATESPNSGSEYAVSGPCAFRSSHWH